MKKRSIIALLLCALLLTGCGAKAGNSAGADMMPNYNGGDMESGKELWTEEIPDVTEGPETELTQEQKLITTMRINAETEDLDVLMASVTGKMKALGGYVESQELYNGSGSKYRSRYANLTIRIPAKNLEQFVSGVAEESNVVSKNQTTENITLTYTAVQSRLKALETEQTRLLELLAKAADMKDLLLIEERLTQVRTELENVTSQLRLYDNLVDYSTVHLYITEVKEYTPVTEPETVGERIGSGFVQSLKDIGAGFTELFIWLVVGLPYLILIGAVVAAVAVPLILRNKKKKKAAKEQAE